MPRTSSLLVCLALAALGTATRVDAAPARSAGAASTYKVPDKASASAVLSGDEKIVHALNRLGFGPRPGEVERVRAQGLGAWIEEQLHPEKLDDSALEASLKSLPLLDAPASTLAVAQEYDTANAIKLLLALQTTQDKPPGSPRALKAQSRLRRAMDDGAMDAAPEAVPQAAPGFASLPLAQRERARLISERAQAAGVVRGDSARAVGALAEAKIARATQSKKQLQEVLVDFWSNHFNLDVRKGPVRTLKIVDEREVIRPRVLGRFRDLLGASAHSPAMLFYLDNARSVAPQAGRGNPNRARNRRPRAARAGGVNENYARELMELHTLGVGGGYTQQDVLEVARCFTGWSLNRDSGEFRFNARAHDNGAKIVLGQTIAEGGGQSDGEAVLDILAAHPSTAKFLARKLCVRLASDEPSQVLVDRVASKWIATKGDLRAVVAEIVYSPEFFARSTARSKIKSPFEFAVSAVRALDAQVTLPDARDSYGATRIWLDGQSLLYPARRRGGGQNLRASLLQEIASMGQPLYAYQAPTGYSEDSRRWVSGGALIARLNFALALSQGQIAHVQMPAQPVLEGLSGDDHAAVLARLNQRLLGGAMTPSTRATLGKQLKPGTPADPIKLTALVLGSPEFQRR